MRFRRIALFAVLMTPLAAHAHPRLDPHGFPLPEGAITRLGDLHFAQPGKIRALAVSSDDKVIATLGSNRIFLWNAQTGRIVREIPAPDSEPTLAFSKNGHMLAGATTSGEFRIWNIAKAEWQRSNREKLPDSQKPITALRFIDGDRLLVVTYGAGVVQLWDVAKGAVTQTWTFEGLRAAKAKELPAFVDVGLSPSGEHMAWLGADGGVFIHETATGKLVRTAKSKRNSLKKVHLVDEGHTLFLQSFGGGKEKSNSLVSALDGSERVSFATRFPISKHPRVFWAAGPTTVLGVSPDGKTLVTGDFFGMIRWDLATGKKLAEVAHDCDALAYFSDGTRAVLAYQARMQICDSQLSPVRPSTGLPGCPTLDFHPDGRILTQHWGSKLVNVWDPAKNKVLDSTTKAKFRSFDDMHSHGYGFWSKRIVLAEDKKFVVRDLATGRELGRLEGLALENDWESKAYFSPDHKRILVSCPEKDKLAFRWFNSDGGAEIGHLIVPKDDVTEALLGGSHITWFARDGSMFGYTTADQRLTLVDCTRSKVDRVIGIAAKERDARWQYQELGDRVAAWRWEPGDDPSTRHEYAIWERATGRLLRRFFIKPALSKEEVRRHWDSSFSPDGRLIAVQIRGTGKVFLYETASGSERGRLQAPHRIEEFEFAPDGKSLATGCEDTTILIWDLSRPLSAKPALAGPRSPDDAERLWKSLAETNAMEAEPALWALVRAPDQALPILKQRLQPARVTPRVWMLIQQLDSSEYSARQAATAELTKLADLALPALYGTLKKGAASLEQKRRIEELVSRLEDPSAIPSCLRELRGVEVLERLGSADARKLLETLATGDPESVLTRDARSVLARWPVRRE
jgi:WD40 repeat protein